MKRILLSLILATGLCAEETNMQAMVHRFDSFSLMLATPPADGWRASWNDRGQMAMFQAASNQVVMTAQYLKFPTDTDLEKATGNRDAYLDSILRKFCAVQFSRSGNLTVRTQEIKITGRELGNNYVRCCPILGHDKSGPRRGYFCAMLRGVTRPKFEGDVIVFTIGYPDTVDAAVEQRVLKSFDVLLQNVSFP